jgi:DNA-binding response OmpR family regulator
MLIAMGAQVDSCNDGKSAVIEFIAHPAKTYDLVMADTVLDEIDGFSVAKCIRISGKEDGETVPIFALTADGSATEIKKAYKYNFTALFSRPIDFVSLFDRVSKEMGR